MEETRGDQIHVRTTEREKLLYELMAKRVGMSVSAWLRLLATNALLAAPDEIRRLVAAEPEKIRKALVLE
jgi:hypothetical protein